MQIDTADFRENPASKRIDTFSHLRLSEVLTLAEVLGCLDGLRERKPAHRFLCTL